MSKRIIGLNMFYHDSSIFVLEEGKIPFGLDRERCTRVKHDHGFPYESLDVYFDQALSTKESIIAHSFGFKTGIPNLGLLMDQKIHLMDWKDQGPAAETPGQLLGKGTRLLFQKGPLFVWQTGVARFYHKLGPGLQQYFSQKTKQGFNKRVAARYPEELRSAESTYSDHHVNHAASAYFMAPFKKGGCITLDGDGDGYCSKIFSVKDREPTYIAGTPDTQSIGALYNYFTAAIGLRPNSDEGKVEALAAFGTENNELYQKLRKQIAVEDLQITLRGKTRSDYSPEALKPFVERYGEEECAAAIQQLLEEVGVELVQKAIDQEGFKSISFAGGVFANVKLNLAILEKTNLKEMYITPPMGDNGTAMGAAFLQARDEGWDMDSFSKYEMPYFGPEYSREEIKETINSSKWKDQIIVEDLKDDWPGHVAELLSKKKIVGIYHGKMEFGPRALGNRSVLADPGWGEVKDIINNTIKRRKPYQPFCPSILESERKRLFVEAYKNKHMTCAFRVKEQYWKEIPAMMHIDGTARAQFVERKDNPKYYELLQELKKYTGYGVVLNTSFNLHGRTIVMTPDDALTDFKDCGIDYLCMDGYLVRMK